MFLLLTALLVGPGCHDDNMAPMGNRPPTVAITSPAPGTTTNEGTEILFAGTATDPEDGALTGAALLWSSSLDGPLGSGDALRLSTLRIGTHTVSLTATDDSGASATATRSLRVLGPPGTTLALDLVVQGLSSPVFLTAPPGDLTRLFIVEQSGTIRIVKNGVLLPAPFLNVSGLIVSGGEQGLLGMAFAPDYASSGRFYVSYTAASNPAGHSVVARYLVSADPDVANAASGLVIITENQPYSNHNGGMIAFGPDGYLYFGLGDGGSGGDPQGHGQNRTELLGSVIRLDVSGTGTYTVPPSNPYAGGTNPRPELWNYGLRNPWRFSFDRTAGDLYIADVGQNAWEEVDVQPAASNGGENYGWNLMEGTHCYTAGCSQTGLTLPVLGYDHGQGCSVTGGYVYRGAAIPALQGLYLYGDYCGGWVRSFRWVGGQATEQQVQPDLSPGESITSFGEDAAGELYIVTGAGRVYRIVLH